MLPALALCEAEQRADHRRLAGAVGTEEAERAAARHLQVDAVERRALAEALGQPVVSIARPDRPAREQAGRSLGVSTRGT